MSTKRRKAERNIAYAREQIHRFLKYEYGIDYRVEVYGNKGLEKRGKYSDIEFKRGKPVAIDISYELLSKGNKGSILKAGLREAVKVALWYKRLPYTESSKEYNLELRKKGLPIYGSVSQTGKDLHTYRCAECKRVYILRERKLPKSKDVTEQNIYTKCCKERFEYAGKIHYTNKELRQIAKQVKRGKQYEV